ncbi:MAG: Rid family detoxifying hydrolase, partial [Bdellovibrio sp.]
MKKIIHTDKAPKAVGPYSQAVQIGDFLFCSGQISINPQTNEVFTGDIKTQTEMVLKNIEAVLAASGLNFSHIVKTTIFLTSMSDFATV